MQASSTLLQLPSTPVSSHTIYPVTLGHGYQPLNSSPLATPSPKSSPAVATQARRRLQFKARTPSTPVASSSRNYSGARSITSSGGSVFRGGVASVSAAIDDPQKAFLREKFKARCFERAARAREKAIRGRRYAGETSSDGFDDVMDDDEEEDDDDIMQDEVPSTYLSLRSLFLHFPLSFSAESWRMLAVNSATPTEFHMFMKLDLLSTQIWKISVNGSGSSMVCSVCYAHDVLCSKFSDACGWPSASTSSSTLRSVAPVDLDDAELEAYAEECTRRAAAADFEDIPPEDLFNWSDSEELDYPHDEDIEMMH